MNKQTVKIHGKEYETVASRTLRFRKDYDGHSIDTDLVVNDGNKVIIKATILKDGVIVASGYAEEERGSTKINTSSAIENCETSAIGRALACYGLIGDSYASADEVANAISGQEIADFKKTLEVKYKAYGEALRDNLGSITFIKNTIDSYQAFGDEHDQLSAAVEAYEELTDEAKMGLRLAPSKGGVFSTEEIAIMKSNEWHAARKAYYGDKDAV